MIKDNIHVLDLLLADQKKQKGVFRSGIYWNDYIKRINYYIHKEGLTTFRSHCGIGKGYADTTTLDPFVSMPFNSRSRLLWKVLSIVPFVDSKIFTAYRELAGKYLNQLRVYKAEYLITEHADLLRENTKLLESIDTMAGEPRGFLEYKGHKIAFSYIEALKRINDAAENVDFTGKSTFMEIGGGFGANAHLLLTMFPNIKTCLYIDIPPMLHVATEYLRHHFDDRVLDYTEFKQQQANGEINLEERIACLPPWCLEDIQLPVDLAWNSCSFQEMDDAQISYYAQWLAQNTSDPKSDVLALFYPFETYERSEKRSIDLLTSAGFEFKTRVNTGETAGENLIYAMGKIKKAA